MRVAQDDRIKVGGHLAVHLWLNAREVALIVVRQWTYRVGEERTQDHRHIVGGERGVGCRQFGEDSLDHRLERHAGMKTVEGG